MDGRTGIEAMDSGKNGPSANVPSISNDTIPIPSLQRLVDDTVQLIAERYANSHRSFDQSYYDELLTDPLFRSAVESRLSTLVEGKGIVAAAEWVEDLRIRTLFG